MPAFRQAANWRKKETVWVKGSTGADTALFARRYPDVQIIMAHLTGIGFRGVLEAKGSPHLFVDTSGYLAEQLPGIFQKAIGSRLQDKALFGTDFPYVDLEKALISFDKMNFKQPVKDKILFANAQALFGLN